jgi:hypothetical protein
VQVDDHDAFERGVDVGGVGGFEGGGEGDVGDGRVGVGGAEVREEGGGGEVAVVRCFGAFGCCGGGFGLPCSVAEGEAGVEAGMELVLWAVGGDGKIKAHTVCGVCSCLHRKGQNQCSTVGECLLE